MSENQKTQLIGQSVDCNVIKSISVEIAFSMMKFELDNKNLRADVSYLQDKKGQISFAF